MVSRCHEQETRTDDRPHFGYRHASSQRGFQEHEPIHEVVPSCRRIGLGSDTNITTLETDRHGLASSGFRLRDSHHADQVFDLDRLVKAVR